MLTSCLENEVLVDVEGNSSASAAVDSTPVTYSGSKTASNIGSFKAYDGRENLTLPMALSHIHTVSKLDNGDIVVVSAEYRTSGSNSYHFSYDDKKLLTEQVMGFNGRDNHTANVISGSTTAIEGDLLVVGGLDETNSPIGDVEIYDKDTNTWSTTGALNQARAYHTMNILSNGDALVVGGYDGAACINSVERFEAETGTWSAQADLPAPLCNHRATLLSNDLLLVSGGQNTWNDGSSATDALYLFNANTNSWSTLSISLPEARFFHMQEKLSDDRVIIMGGYSPTWSVVENGIIISADLQSITTISDMMTDTGAPIGVDATMTVLDNDDVIVIGGLDGATELTRTAIFTPGSSGAGSWRVVEDIPESYYGHQAIKDNNGNVIIFGGTRAGEFIFMSYYFNVLNEEWIAYTSDIMIPVRLWHTSTKLPDGRIFNFGGVNVTDAYIGNEHWYPEIYDPKTNRWEKILDIELNKSDEFDYMRYHHNAVAFPANDRYPEGGVFIQGGYGFFYDIPRTIVFNISTNKFEKVEPVPFQSVPNVGQDISEVLMGASAELITVGPNKGKILLIGGWDYGSGIDHSTAIIYDPESDAWEATGSMPTPRCEHKSVTLSDGKVLVVGSWDKTDLSSAIYDPETEEWTQTGDTNLYHGDSFNNLSWTLTALPNGRAIIIGGASTAKTTAEIFDPISGSWALLSGLTPREAHSATALPSGKVLVAGGWWADPVTAETFDPSTYIFTPTGGDMIGPPIYGTTNCGERYWQNAILLDDERILFDSGIPVITTVADLADTEFYTTHEYVDIEPTGGSSPYTYELISGEGTIYPELNLFIPAESFSGAQIKATSASGESSAILTIDP